MEGMVIMTIKEAIKGRHSVRQYKDMPIAEDLRQELQQLIDELRPCKPVVLTAYLVADMVELLLPRAGDEGLEIALVVHNAQNACICVGMMPCDNLLGCLVGRCNDAGGPVTVRLEVAALREPLLLFTGDDGEDKVRQVVFLDVRDFIHHRREVVPYAEALQLGNVAAVLLKEALLGVAPYA